VASWRQSRNCAVNATDRAALAVLGAPPRLNRSGFRERGAAPCRRADRSIYLVDGERARQSGKQIFVLPAADAFDGVQPNVQLIVMSGVFVKMPVPLAKPPSQRTGFAATHHMTPAISMAHVDEVTADRGQRRVGSPKTVGGAGGANQFDKAAHGCGLAPSKATRHRPMIAPRPDRLSRRRSVAAVGRAIAVWRGLGQGAAIRFVTVAFGHLTATTASSASKPGQLGRILPGGRASLRTGA